MCYQLSMQRNRKLRDGSHRDQSEVLRVKKTQFTNLQCKLSLYRNSRKIFDCPRRMKSRNIGLWNFNLSKYL